MDFDDFFCIFVNSLWGNY